LTHHVPSPNLDEKGPWVVASRAGEPITREDTVADFQDKRLIIPDALLFHCSSSGAGIASRAVTQHYLGGGVPHACFGV